MELQNDRIEITLRMLQNGRHVWTITANTTNGSVGVELLKQLDGELRNAFPNHVKVNSGKFVSFESE